MGTEELTPREFDVLEQIVHGKSNKEIATELDISEATVKTHINSLLGKLGVTDRTQAATAAIQRGHCSARIPQEAETMKRPLRSAFSARCSAAGCRSHRAAQKSSLAPGYAMPSWLRCCPRARRWIKEHIETEMRTASGYRGCARALHCRSCADHGGLLRRWQVFALSAGAGAGTDRRGRAEAGRICFWLGARWRSVEACISTRPQRARWWATRRRT